MRHVSLLTYQDRVPAVEYPWLIRILLARHLNMMLSRTKQPTEEERRQTEPPSYSSEEHYSRTIYILTAP